jgi:hypothetical protein
LISVLVSAFAVSNKMDNRAIALEDQNREKLATQRLKEVNQRKSWAPINDLE